MKKKLPINTDPFIRTYTHHGYLHAVIGSDDKVSLEDSIVASIGIERYSNYRWNMEMKGLDYNILGDRIDFYGNKWNIDMRASFWRRCSFEDWISLEIYDQLYSNVWSSIYIFLANDKTDYIDFDSSYEMIFGNFSKDGIFFKTKDPDYEVLLPDPAIPFGIKLKIQGAIVSLELYEENKLKYSLNKELSSENSYKYIGVGVSLRSNSYYEWLFSHYINIYVNRLNAMHIDFLGSKHKNYGCYTFNYFIDYSEVAEKQINKRIKTIQFIKNSIDEDKYIEILINDKLNDNSYTFDYFHQDFIYGYDDEKEVLELLYYYNGRIKKNYLSYKLFESKDNELENRVIHTYYYNPGYEMYSLSPKRIMQLFIEFRDSENISYNENCFDKSYIYGLSAIEILVQEDYFALLLSDIRISHLLYERSKCNLKRIEYLFCKKIFDFQQYEQLVKLCENSYFKIQIIRNLILKNQHKNKEKRIKIKEYLHEYYCIEKQLTDFIIHCLGRNIDH